MRSLATLGGVLVIVVLAIAWRISNNRVEAGNDAEPHVGIVTLGMKPDADQTVDEGSEVNPASNGNYGAAGNETNSPTGEGASGDSTGSDSVDPNRGGSAGAANPPANDPATNTGGESGGNSGSGSPGTDSTRGNATTDPPGQDPATEQGGDNSTPEPSPASKDVVYTVQEGDTLYRILMNAYGKATPDLIEEIAVANQMDDPGAISPGDELKLPKVEGYPDPKMP
jgi:nucleoid-associated protein YgaU